MTQPTTNHTANHPPSLPPAVPPRAHATIPPTLSWPDFAALAGEITTLSTVSHTIKWHIAIAQAFQAISWEQSAEAEHKRAWRAWSYGFLNTSADHHADARHALTQAVSCWSKAARALSRALAASQISQQHPEEEQDDDAPSTALADVAQCRTFFLLIAAQQDRIRQLALWLDRERLTTSITGQKPVLRATASSNEEVRQSQQEGRESGHDEQA